LRGLVKVHECGEGSVEVKETVMLGAALKQKKDRFGPESVDLS
jgi:hypothetical protein